MTATFLNLLGFQARLAARGARCCRWGPLQLLLLLPQRPSHVLTHLPARLTLLPCTGASLLQAHPDHHQQMNNSAAESKTERTTAVARSRQTAGCQPHLI